MRDQQAQTSTIHVKVTVQKDGDKYIATYDPKVIQVYESDTIINFKLDEPTPDDIVVKSVSIIPKDQEQLSTPSISKNGRQVVLSDVNSLAQTLSLSFEYKSKHDHALQLAKDGEMEVVYPQVENNPPGMVAMAMLAVDGGPENNPPG